MLAEYRRPRVCCCLGTEFKPGKVRRGNVILCEPECPVSGQ